MEANLVRPGLGSQYDTLVDRNVSILFGSCSGMLLLLLQPPALGYVIGLAWKNQQAIDTTYFCMTIAAVYLGCMNACCVIVRERQVFDRERMFDLNLWSYVLSKMTVLAVISGVQMVLLLVSLSHLTHLPPALFDRILIWSVLTMGSVAASGLGLFISSCASTCYGAVIAVPSLIVPQIVFSKVVLGTNIDRKLPALLHQFTLTKWCYDGLDAVAQSNGMGVLLVAVLVLLLESGVFLVLTALKLRLDEE